jgi:lycopene cyclase domain-containing protein
VFVYECVRCYFPGIKNSWPGDKVLMGMGIALLVTGLFFYEKYYTSWTFIFCSIFIGILFLGRIFFKDFDASFFLVSFAIICFPFLIVNGFLTAIPIVFYNNEENLGLRIYTIPFEDVFYGMLLIMMDIAIYEKLRNGNSIRVQ